MTPFAGKHRSRKAAHSAERALGVGEWAPRVRAFAAGMLRHFRAIEFVMTDRLIISRTGRKVAFLDIPIGSPFFAHERYWVRVDFEAASVLGDTGESTSCCNFLIDGTASPCNGPYLKAGEKCELVEAVTVKGA